MGSVAIPALLPAPPSSVDEAREIGAVPVQTAITAMRVGYDQEAENKLVYLGETPVFVGMIWRLVDYGDRQRHRWWRLEAKVDPRRADIRRGDKLVVAEHPYGNGWLQHAPFKPGSKKGAMERPDLALQAFASPAALIQWIEEKLSYDFWEKGNYLTAGISEPNLPFNPSGALRNVQHHALFVFGSCADFTACERALQDTEAVRELLKDTANGSIRFWSPKLKRSPKLEKLPKLCAEVKLEAPSLMTLSIRQALAGPHEESEKWIGRRVTDKVSHIYRGHLNSRNRTLVRNRRKEQTVSDENYFDSLQDGEEDWDFAE